MAARWVHFPKAGGSIPLSATTKSISEMAKKIERKVADTILQKPQEVKIGDTVYQMAPPTLSTLITVSELIARLPAVKMNTDDLFKESMYVAKDCAVLGEILAVLILGTKDIKEKREVEQTRFFGLLRTRRQIEVDRKMELAQKILNEVSPAELNTILIGAFQEMQISDFFGLTTSLLEINLLRRTREVVTTAFGL